MSVAASAPPQDRSSPSPFAAEGDRPRASLGGLPPSPLSPGSMAISLQRYETPQTNPYTPYAEAASQLTSSETSPSAAAMSTQTSQQLIAAATNTFPTPASSVSGYPASLTRPNTKDDDGDVTMRVGEDDSPAVMGSPSGGLEGFGADATLEHRRTNHDREGTITSMEDVPGRRASKRPSDTDHMESGPRVKRRRSRDDRAIFERLRADVGPLYLLCQTPHPVSRPRPTQDLLSLYGLQPLAATVARTDPATGEKRKMRKTYKGKIQAFGLAGRNQEVKHPEGQAGGLVEMMQWPEEEWQAQKVSGKEVEKGLGDDMLAKLERALKMQPGPLPGFDAAVLGLDAPAAPTAVDSRKASQVAGGASKPAAAAVAAATAATTKSTTKQNVAATGAIAASGGGNGGGGGAGPVSEPARPKRAGKKRRYDDRSFEGYEDGFVDDELDDVNSLSAGVSVTDRDDRRGSGGLKKRKKNPDQYAGGDAGGGGGGSGGAGGGGAGGGGAGTAAAAAGLMERGGGSYGVGMVGIGSGLGAYGSR